MPLRLIGKMKCRIIEIKARCTDIDRVRQILNANRAVLKGIDHQIDTYFSVPEGRLKCREGDIESGLIFYRRKDQLEPKLSNVEIFHAPNLAELKQILVLSIGIKVVIDKKREIYFLENVKVHLDDVRGLGTFVEIETIDETGSILVEALERQCRQIIKLLQIKDKDRIDCSYSDMLLKMENA